MIAVAHVLVGLAVVLACASVVLTLALCYVARSSQQPSDNEWEDGT